MNLVANHYRSIVLPADQVARISSYLKETLSDRREAAEAAEGQITLRIQRLNHERTKLLQLHYADAAPIELFKSEQERITREFENARHGLASVSLEFDQSEQNMMRALELSRDCHSAYVAAPERVRRHFNQAFFEKIYVRDDGEVRHDLAEPFQILLDPDLSDRLRPPQEQRRTVRSVNKEDRAQGAVVGSNVELLVQTFLEKPYAATVSRLTGHSLGDIPRRRPLIRDDGKPARPIGNHSCPQAFRVNGLRTRWTLTDAAKDDLAGVLAPNFVPPDSGKKRL
ncbi:MAG: hypothetical protein ACLQUT_06545 [Thermoleophilia bacterium]